MYLNVFNHLLSNKHLDISVVFLSQIRRNKPSFLEVLVCKDDHVIRVRLWHGSASKNTLKFCRKYVKGHHGNWTGACGGGWQVLPDWVSSASPVQAWVGAYKEPPSGLWTMKLWQPAGGWWDRQGSLYLGADDSFLELLLSVLVIFKLLHWIGFSESSDHPSAGWKANAICIYQRGEWHSPWTQLLLKPNSFGLSKEENQ